MGEGQLYIDGHDAYTEYGLRLLQGAYDELVALPPLKEPDFNDWQEEDGIEADLQNPVLGTRNVAIRFYFAGIFNGYGEFIALLTDKAYHTFEFAEIKRTFKLRLISAPQQGDVWNKGLVTLRFADDFPMLGWEQAPKPVPETPWDDYYIDGKDIATYGIRVLKGTRAELQRIPAVKTAATSSSKYSEGCTYDDYAKVTFKAKNVRIPCLMRKKNIEDLWRNCGALLHALIQPEERHLYSKQLEQTFSFFYKSFKVLKFAPYEGWLQFELTITITGNARPDTTDGFILTAENHDIIDTDDAGAISLTPNK